MICLFESKEAVLQELFDFAPWDIIVQKKPPDSYHKYKSIKVHRCTTEAEATQERQVSRHEYLCERMFAISVT